MKITSIHLENYRKFISLKMNLNEDFNVIIGANGSGKTTVMEALTVALGSLLIALPNTQSESIKASDAREIITNNHGLLTREAFYPISVHAGGLWNGGSGRWTRSLNGSENKTTHGDAGEIKEFASTLLEGLRTHDETILPLVAYYDARGMRSAKRESKVRSELGSRLLGYWNCLAGEANLKEQRRWMMEQELAAFQGSPRVPHLDAIERAVLSCINEERTAVAFRYDAQLKDLAVEWGDGRKEPLERLSAGYQRIISIVVDLAWRACTLNPALGASAPAKIEGVVLVDELDMHLHPTWQHRVIGDLRRTFPKLQWITTTHSPTLLTHTRREWLRVLSAEEIQEVGEFKRGLKGRQIGDILLHVMGASLRDQGTREALDEAAQAIERGELERASAKIAELCAQLGEEDEDVMHLTWELDWRMRED
jgi:predicted ATP-binding protein involved in virulence